MAYPKNIGSAPVRTRGQYDSPVGAMTAVLAQTGLVGAPITKSEINTNFVSMFTKSTGATGDTRGIYWRHYFGGAEGGEVARLWANVAYDGVAAGGTVNALHATLSVDALCSISGAANAIRATLSAAAATRSLGGNAAALQLASDIGAANTVPTSWSFIRVTDDSSVKINQLLNLPVPGTGTILAVHTTQTAMTHSIKIVDAAGTAYYIMCTNVATNRS